MLGILGQVKNGSEMLSIWHSFSACLSSSSLYPLFSERLSDGMQMRIGGVETEAEGRTAVRVNQALGGRALRFLFIYYYFFLNDESLIGI